MFLPARLGADVVDAGAFGSLHQGNHASLFSALPLLRGRFGAFDPDGREPSLVNDVLVASLLDELTGQQTLDHTRLDAGVDVLGERLDVAVRPLCGTQYGGLNGGVGKSVTVRRNPRQYAAAGNKKGQPRTVDLRVLVEPGGVEYKGKS